MRGRKIAISGKGGVGKSTLTAAIARILAERGNTVLAIDADPDANLASAFGMPSDVRALIRPIVGQRDLIEQRTGAKFGRSGQMFNMSPDVADVASKYGVAFKGVSVLVLGAVKTGGSGCACPENTFLKKLIRHLVLHEGETVVIDMEPGIEHLGRATAEGVDAMVVVVEPGTRSLETARRIMALSRDIGLFDKLFFVCNKARNKADEETASVLAGAKMLGTIPFDARFVDADCAGVSVFDMEGKEDLIAHFETITEVLLKKL